MKRLVVSFVLSFTTSVQAFEIKPICPFVGAYCKSANISDLEIQHPASKKCHNEKRHAFFGNNQPVHEAITRTAYNEAFGKKLIGYNYQQPLIGGVEWNDDPEVLTRKMWYNSGLSKVINFIKVTDKKMQEKLEDKKTITYQSHYGNMQFLHAMKSNSELGDQEVKQQIYDWIKNAYAVAKGDIKYNQDIKGTYFEKYFTEDLGYKKIYQIFDPHKMYIDDFRTKRFASGSILHIIQDSYSKSHTVRRGCQIIKFENYPNDNHCLSDINSNENKKEIMKAVEMSARYMKIKDNEKANDWCKNMVPLIKEIFDIQKIEDNSCPI